MFTGLFFLRYILQKSVQFSYHLLRKHFMKIFCNFYIKLVGHVQGLCVVIVLNIIPLLPYSSHCAIKQKIKIITTCECLYIQMKVYAGWYIIWQLKSTYIFLVNVSVCVSVHIFL